MEVTTVLTYVFGSTSVVSIVSFFIYYKLNRKQKTAEVAGIEEDTEEKNIANEKSKIELGDRYLQSIVKLEDTFKGNTEAVNKLADKIERVLDEQERHNRVLNAIRGYLDGNFEKWLAENEIKID